MFQCFVTTNKKRPYYLELTLKALQLSGISPIIIEKPMLERYYECEKQSTGDYILIDDDIIPATKDTLQKLMELLGRYPDYAQIGLGWKPNMNSESGNSWIRNKENEELWEFDHCGGCVAIRKGIIENYGLDAEFPSGYGDDRVMGKIARNKGYKVGVATKLWFHNLGIKDTTNVQ